MSGIYGVIDFKRKNRHQNIVARMQEQYHACRIDRYEHKGTHNAEFGCGIQYFTKEAPDEILPILDEEQHLLFTADCVLDNRKELMEALRVTDAGIPDGTLLFLSYKKWGRQCTDHVQGIFAFVVYNWEANTAELYADHFSQRCLYFHLRDGILYFSTLLFPLMRGSGLSFEQNERWIVDCTSLYSPAMITESRACALQDVFKVNAGCLVTADAEHFTYITYWDPVKTIPTDHTMTDEHCKKELLECLTQSVSACLRTEGEVGIKLSSGLDSTTVAGIAAPLLSKEGKNLYSFTSTPIKSDVISGYYIADETPGVKLMCEAYPNIIPTFLNCEGQTILSEGERLVDVWELPCKSSQNTVWIDEINRTASARGCRIMLSGATGNTTLSAGYFENYFYSLLCQFHFLRAHKALKIYCRRNRIGRKKYIKLMLRDEWNHIRKCLSPKKALCYEHNLTRQDIGEKHALTKRFYGKKGIMMFPPFKTLNTMREEIYLMNGFSQIGTVDTKNSLTYGVLERDPLRTVPFVSFCMKLPMGFFVNEFYERRLVREFMKDIVPDGIRLDRHRGQQSADSSYRLSLTWAKTEEQFHEAMQNPLLYRYLDRQKVMDAVACLGADTLEEHPFEAYVLVNVYTLSLFLSKISN